MQKSKKITAKLSLPCFSCWRSIREIKTSSKLSYIHVNSHTNHSLQSTDNKRLQLWKKRIMINRKITLNAIEKTRFDTKITAGCHAKRKIACQSAWPCYLNIGHVINSCKRPISPIFSTTIFSPFSSILGIEI